MKRIVVLGLMGLSLAGCMEAANAVSLIALPKSGDATANTQTPPKYRLVCDNATPSHCHNE